MFSLAPKFHVKPQKRGTRFKWSAASSEAAHHTPPSHGFLFKRRNFARIANATAFKLGRQMKRMGDEALVPCAMYCFCPSGTVLHKTAGVALQVLGFWCGSEAVTQRDTAVFLPKYAKTRLVCYRTHLNILIVSVPLGLPRKGLSLALCVLTFA